MSPSMIDDISHSTLITMPGQQRADIVRVEMQFGIRRSFPCNRCRLPFSSVASLCRHIQDSLDHNICRLCGYKADFDTFTALQDHLENDHVYCEPCQWRAPSGRGLFQHNLTCHVMCPICRQFFLNRNELQGHMHCHRPNNAVCFLCGKDFPVMSAVFNHIESENCEGGGLREDVRGLAREFVQHEPGYPRNMTSNSPLFRCWTCGRGYQRLSDLLQHSETRSCRDGYWKGTGNTGRLVQYVRVKLKKTIDDRLANILNGGDQSNSVNGHANGPADGGKVEGHDNAIKGPKFLVEK